METDENSEPNFPLLRTIVWLATAIVAGAAMVEIAVAAVRGGL